MKSDSELSATIEALIGGHKGILAADESNSTIAKRLTSVGVESIEENRLAYRLLLLGTPGLREFVGGVILFEETLGQLSDDGTPLPEIAAAAGIVPGIKVDAGKIPMAHSSGDEITEGIDGLAIRLDAYKRFGARFAKWRAVFNVTDVLPSATAVIANAELLARYAAICQSQGVVPIVEPEVLMDGAHTIERCAEVNTAVLSEVFAALRRHRVVLEQMLLKPAMILPGSSNELAASPELVASHTLQVLRSTVPASVAGIAFLSGGQSPVQATANLDAINRAGTQPWPLSFSYGRALQEPVLELWKGQATNSVVAQRALLMRARLNSAARAGRYDASMEPAA